MADKLLTPMDIYFYVLNLSDDNKWANSDDYIGVLTHLRIQYSDICSGGDLIINRLIDSLESAIRNQKPTDFIRDVKNEPSGTRFVTDYICPVVCDWENGEEADPWWAC